MIASLGAKLACFLMKSGRLSVDDANKCTEIFLKNLNGWPICDIIYVEDGQLFLGGVPVDLEKARDLHISADSALNNKALKIIREQIAFEAINIGIHKAEVPAQMFFARAVLWWEQQLTKKLELLAQRNQEPPLSED